MSDYIKELRDLVGHRPLLLCGCGAYIIKDNKVLLQRRRDNGMWAAHGGIMEPGETTDGTMIREILEETGLSVTKYEFFCIASGKEVYNVYPNGDECYFVNVVYIVTDFTGELKPQDLEVSQLHWFSYDTLPRVDEMNPADRFSYRLLRQRLGIDE